MEATFPDPVVRHNLQREVGVPLSALTHTPSKDGIHGGN
jgi:hypothetical protein